MEDMQPDDERPVVLVDASMLATNVASLCSGIALRILKDYLERTDKATALEALELALQITPNPLETPKVDPEVEGMYYFKAALNITLEACTKRVLDNDD
jgi:hypothetical protein